MSTIPQSLYLLDTAWAVWELNPDGGKFLHALSRPALDPPSLLYNGYVVFPGVNIGGAWRWPPNSSSANVNEVVELYLYSACGP